MLTKLVVVIGSVSLALGALGLTLGGPAGAAPAGSLCQLNGTATFAPNGPGASTSFGYSLTGTLSGCQSSIAGAPASGAAAVGQVVTEQVPITTSTGAVVTGTAQYQEPLATGKG